jgi:hypothetical protein
MPIRPTTLRSEGGSLVEEESAWSFPFFSSFVDPSLELGAGYPEYFAVDCDLEDCSRDGMGSGSLITCSFAFVRNRCAAITEQATKRRRRLFLLAGSAAFGSFAAFGGLDLLCFGKGELWVALCVLRESGVEPLHLFEASLVLL